MSDDEFGEQAAHIVAQIADLTMDEQIAAACRGSGNPAALAWIAENLRLGPASVVVDLGAGLGGPSAWMRARYGCTVIAVEPEAPAAHAARSIFGLPTVVSGADAAPFGDDTFDSALLLGVVSVVDDAGSALAEARRIAGSLGLIDYCATGREVVPAGGSTFRTADQLRELVDRSWRITQFAPVGVDPPDTWADAADEVESEPDPNEAEVVAAIEGGLISPVMLVAGR